MAHEDVRGALNAAPRALLIAGSNDAASEHWLARWEAGFGLSSRVELDFWDNPDRFTWVKRLNQAIVSAGGPVVLVTHGVACLAVAWWVQSEQREETDPVRAAILHDPPVLGRAASDPRLRDIAAGRPISQLFPVCMLASRTRALSELACLRRVAREWDCSFDTMGEGAVPRTRVRQVQSLGERFVASALSEKFIPMQPPEGHSGYPFVPRNR